MPRTNQARRIWPLVAVMLLAIVVRASFYVDQVLDQSVSIAALPSLSLVVDQTNLTHADRIIAGLAGLLYRLAGVNAFTSAFIPVASALLTGALLLAFPRLWAKKSQIDGLAAFLWLVLPVGVFLSTNLLSAFPLIFINTAAIYCYLHWKKRAQPALLVLASALLLLALWLHWTYAVGNAVFVAWDLAQSRLAPAWRKRLVVAGLLLSAAFLLATGSSGLALEQYYLIRMVDENLILFPLLALAAVYASLAKETERPAELLTWLGTKAILMLVVAKGLAADPNLANLGMSTYWLDLMVPGCLMIAWAIGHKLKNAETLNSALGYVSLGGILVLLLAGHTHALITISRIAFGLALVLFAGLLAFWNTPRLLKVFAIFTGVFLLGAFSLAHNYWLSYSGLSYGTRAILDALPSQPETELFVGDERLLPRINFLGGFEKPVRIGNASLDVKLLERSEVELIPNGAFVVMSEYYKDFLFGLIPSNWVLVTRTQAADLQGLLLYQVRP